VEQGALGARLTLILVLLVGLSEAVGESVVLFLNRVKPRRFILSLVISAVLFAFTYGFWVLSIYLVTRFAFDSDATVVTIARIVAISYAPRLFGFLAFIPFFGVPISYALQLWSLLAMIQGVTVVLGLSPLQAVASVVLGAVLLLVLNSTIGRPITGIARWLRARAAGRPIVTDRRRLRQLVDAGPEWGLQSPADREEKRPRQRRAAG